MWPQHITVRPSVRSLVKAYAPPVQPPTAVGANDVKKYEENQAAVKEAEAAVTKATEILMKIVAEKTAVDGKANGINRWSNKGATLAQQQRLQKEIEFSQANKDKAHLLHNTLMDAGKPLKFAVEAYEEDVKKYQKHLETLKMYRELRCLLEQ